MDRGRPFQEAASSPNTGHQYTGTSITGNANVHMGDVHYHSSQVLNLMSSTVSRTLDHAANRGPQNVLEVQQMIRSFLWFPTMRDREEMIHRAYVDTYEWIYCDPTGTLMQWDNFKDFLQSNSKTYWITGRPGSGKSTLMKYIIHEPRTQEALRVWTGGKTPTIASFYFYYKGSTLQRSEVGVLRSMLSQILRRRGHLIEIAFPDLYNALCRGVHIDMESSLTYWELKGAFERVIRNASGEYFFLAVDGIDEYDAHSAEMGLLVRTFKSLSQLPNVKVLLSSRPWVVFEQNFVDCPRLEIHKLTRLDITRYVEDKISSHPHLQQLMKKHSDEIKTLTNEIVEASAGVFLWVSLVVRSLVEGLSNSDSVTNLRQRLLELPTDLEELYLHMWSQVPSIYHSQASRILQTVDFCTANGQHVSLLGLALTEEDADDGGDLVLRISVGPLSMEEIKVRHESMKTRLASRCFGLVEICNFHTPPTGYGVCGDVYFNPTEDALGSPRAVFLHRTVHEFIHSSKIREMLHLAAAEPYGTDEPFRPEVAALRLFLLRIHTYQWTPLSNRVFSVTFARLVHQCLEVARLAEEASGKTQERLLLKLDKSMAQYFTRLNQNPQGGHWSSGMNIQGKYPPKELALQGAAGFLYLAIRYGLLGFVREQLANMESLGQSGSVLLYSAMHPFQTECLFLRPYVPLAVTGELLGILVGHGADLQHIFFGKSATQRFFDWLSDEEAVLSLKDLGDLPTIVDLIISRGSCRESTEASIYDAINKCEHLLRKANDLKPSSANLQRFIAEMPAVIKRLQSTHHLDKIKETRKKFKQEKDKKFKEKKVKNSDIEEEPVPDNTFLNEWQNVEPHKERQTRPPTAKEKTKFRQWVRHLFILTGWFS